MTRLLSGTVNITWTLVLMVGTFNFFRASNKPLRITGRKIKQFKMSALLLFLLAFLMASSSWFQAAQDLVLILLAGYIVTNWFHLARSARLVFLQHRWFWMVCVLYVIWSGVTIWLAPKSYWHDVKCLLAHQSFIHLFLATLLFHSQERLTQVYRVMARWVVVLAAFSCLYGIVMHIKGFDPIFQRDTGRLLGSVNSATYHAHNVSILLAWVTPFVWTETHRSIGSMLSGNITRRQFGESLLLGMGYLLMLSSVYLTFTRGAWLAVTITLLWFWLTLPNSKAKIVTMVISLLVLGGLFVFDSRLGNRFSQSFDGESDLARKALFLVHLDMFLERPWTGQGYYQYKKESIALPFTSKYPELSDDELKFSHAHNQFLQVASNTGIPGVVLFLLLLFYLARRMFLFKQKADWLGKWGENQIMERDDQKAVRLAFIATIILFLTDQTFEYGLSRTVIIMIWAWILASDMSLNKTDVRSDSRFDPQSTDLQKGAV
ncbi:MAG: O-antigen ligase family protein [Bdellovibrionaceae bacterium]|nr:O-antigen ligase family protein [Pseudobdellovibrionaceae bacterium]MDW8190574.1 O-antigen ligase family protein [Pseudobdellovibrionaceae bacterium]